MKTGQITSPTKQKVLLLLQAGLALGIRRRRLGQQALIISQVAKEWQAIERQYLYRILREFKHEKLVAYEEQADGRIRIILTEKGKKKTLAFDFDNLTLPRPPSWDGKWRLVLYDIPEKRKAARNSLREKLRELGFHEWQKSVWVYPFPCRDQVEFIIEFLEIRSYVRWGELTTLLNEAELKLAFDLT